MQRMRVRYWPLADMPLLRKCIANKRELSFLNLLVGCSGFDGPHTRVDVFFFD